MSDCLIRKYKFCYREVCACVCVLHIHEYKLRGFYLIFIYFHFSQMPSMDSYAITIYSSRKK